MLRRILVGLCSLSALAALGASPASAALKKYGMIIRTISSGPNTTPAPDVVRARIDDNDHTALVDSADGPSPVLRLFVRATDSTTTVLVPGLLTNIFVSNKFREGPGAIAATHGNAPPPFTGTGGIATNIRWGTVTGWTVTGSFWCNSAPAVICGLAMGMDEDTVDPRFNSDFYDLGTWVFHGTGFTSTPFINSYNTNSFGNTLIWVRGFPNNDATVPALPLLGTLVLGSSLAAGGLAALRRRRSRH